MTLDYDPDADAVYLRPSVPFAFTQHVDDERNIDYGPDEQPIGVELLGVSPGRPDRPTAACRPGPPAGRRAPAEWDAA